MCLGTGPVRAAVKQPEFLTGNPGLGQLLVTGVTVKPGQQSGPATLGVVVGPAAQQSPNSVERIVTATSVASEVALDPPAHCDETVAP